MSMGRFIATAGRLGPSGSPPPLDSHCCTANNVIVYVPVVNRRSEVDRASRGGPLWSSRASLPRLRPRPWPAPLDSRITSQGAGSAGPGRCHKVADRFPRSAADLACPILPDPC